jgi:hypothetical protein
MHPFLTRQKINYGIYLIELKEGLTFNRAMLMNIGFIEAIKDTEQGTLMRKLNIEWDCFVFHDIDLIPEDERLLYTCSSEYPIHFAVSVRKLGYM